MRPRWLPVLLTLLLPATLGFVMVLIGLRSREPYGHLVVWVTPFLCGMGSGFASVVLIPKRGFGFRLLLSALSACATLTALLLVGADGAICLAILAPVAIGSAIFGALFGILIAELVLPDARRQAWLLVASVGVVIALMFAPPGRATGHRTVRTELIIDAPIERVWDAVIAFSPIEAEPAWFFRLGIAYPTHAQIDGEGVGAVRTCHFSTGAFVEPITVWDPPAELSFDVVQQPRPMNEISLWQIHPEHLDSAVRSRRGQFLLEPLSDGRTRLIGTTWIEIFPDPEFYFGAITEYLVHRIHERVLRHIQASAEGEPRSARAARGQDPVVQEPRELDLPVQDSPGDHSPRDEG